MCPVLCTVSCVQIGLLDNITEHLDVLNAFQLMLHRKRGRMGPAHTPKPPADMTAAGRPGIAAGATAPASCGSAANAAQHVCVMAAAGPSSAVCELPCGSPEPDVLKVVHVLRPNDPAVLRAPTADGVNNAIDGSDSRPNSPSLQPQQSKEGVQSSRPGSSSMYGKRAAGRAAAATSGMDSITSIDAEEMLELLLLVSLISRCCFAEDRSSWTSANCHNCVVLQQLHWLCE